MKIKSIIDKIIIEADINASEYTVVERLADVHQTRLQLATIMRQSGALAKTVEQTEVLVTGDQNFNKPFSFAEILKIEYRATGGAERDYVCLEKRKDCNGVGCNSVMGVMTYTEDNSKIYIWEGLVGELRVTYSDDRIIEWVEADYTADVVSPDELREVYHPLLWMAQVRRHAGYFSKERYEQIMMEANELMQSFENDIARDRPSETQIIVE